MSEEEIEEPMSKNERIFLMASNIIISGTIFLDLLLITNIISVRLDYFALYNLIVLGVSLFSYRLKRRINRDLKEMHETTI